VVTWTGLQFMVQHSVIMTGRQVFNAVVDSDGVPEYTAEDLISQSGNFFPGSDMPFVCAALSGP